jgi:Uma2 family endonuclease
MSTAAPRLLTAEEFARLPSPTDGSKQELVKGLVVTMPPPGFLHGVCQLNIAALLRQHARATQAGRVTVESGVVTESGPATVRGPDVAFWSFARLPPADVPVVYANVAPDLVVEVRSPGNTVEKLTAKVEEYFAAGCRLVWLVDPLDCTVTIYRQPGDGLVLWSNATLTGDDVLPGFSCKVSDFFE